MNTYKINNHTRSPNKNIKYWSSLTSRLEQWPEGTWKVETIAKTQTCECTRIELCATSNSSWSDKSLLKYTQITKHPFFFSTGFG